MIVKIRRDSRAQWQEVNPVLRPYEPGGEIDYGGVKLGDGETDWRHLPYLIPPLVGGRPWIREGLIVGWMTRGYYPL